MHHASLLASASIFAVLAATTGCSSPGDTCTLEARASVSVEVVDDAGAAVDDAEVTFRVDDGDDRDCEHLGDNRWACGFEQEGEIVVVASRDGFVDVERRFTIEKTADGCHVEGESVTITLQPVPPA